MVCLSSFYSYRRQVHSRPSASSRQCHNGLVFVKLHYWSLCILSGCTSKGLPLLHIFSTFSCNNSCLGLCKLALFQILYTQLECHVLHVMFLLLHKVKHCCCKEFTQNTLTTSLLFSSPAATTSSFLSPFKLRLLVFSLCKATIALSRRSSKVDFISSSSSSSAHCLLS